MFDKVDIETFNREKPVMVTKTKSLIPSIIQKLGKKENMKRWKKK